MTRTRLLTLCATAFVLAALLGSGAAAGTGSFTDPTGDAAAAPDITSIALSDDARTGLATLVVTASNLTPGGSVDVFLDTDKNGATGSPSGSEYWFEVWQEADDWGWDVQHWSGSGWQETPNSATERFSRSGDVFTWTFAQPDIGGATGFAFWGGGFLFDGASNLLARDLAPDGGTWTYDLASAAIVVPTVGKPLAVPANPVAGKLLSLSFPVVRSDTGAPLAGGTVTVKTSIAGKTVPSVGTIANSTVNIAVQIPRKTKGKTLQVKVTVTLAGKSGSRTVSFAIRK